MQKRSACFYAANSGVGLVADVSLIQDLLFDEYDIDINYTQQHIPLPGNESPPVFADYDVGIFFQEYDIQWLSRNKINILIANEEWLQSSKLSTLKHFDKIITKSSFAQQLLRPYNTNVVSCGFISKDRYNSSVAKQDKFLHALGKSSQKGTEGILNSFTNFNSSLPLTIIESREGCTLDKVCTTPNFNYIKDFITEEDMNIEFNKHIIHLCPSYYEGWGHYLYEALSTGALVYASKIPMFLEWIDPELVVFLDCNFIRSSEKISYFAIRENFYPHQFGWQVDQNILNEEISNYKKHLENHNPELVRKFFKDLIDKNSKKLFLELTNV